MDNNLRIKSVLKSAKSPIILKSPKPLEKQQEIENYFPKERLYKANFIGEVKLNRSVHRLSTPIFETHIRQSSLPEPIKAEENINVTEFLKLAKISIRKKPNYRYCFMRSVRELTSLSLPLEKLAEIPLLLPQEPYELSQSHIFLQAVKSNDLSKVDYLLIRAPGLVYCFDDLEMTGLHWAALRNYISMIELLISHHSLINSIDANHRTSLFIAVKKGHVEAVRAFLMHRADATIPSNSKKTPLKIAKNIVIIDMLKRILLIHNQTLSLSKKMRDEAWKSISVPYLTKLSL